MKNILKKLRHKLSSKNNPIFIGFYKYIYSPPKNSLPELLDHLSKLSHQITVIQIGANDGITNDPIHKFIKRDNWNGILLEPQKGLLAALQKLYAKNQGIKIMNAALGSEDGFSNLYKVGFSNARWATGLATFNKALLENSIENGHIKKYATLNNIKIPTDKNKQIIKEKIQVISTDSLLKSNAISHLDLLQIDAEGYDYELIKLFLQNSFKIKPRVIIYEHCHLSEEDHEKCKRYLINNNYITKQFCGDTAALLKSNKPYFHSLKILLN